MVGNIATQEAHAYLDANISSKVSSPPDISSPNAPSFCWSKPALAVRAIPVQFGSDPLVYEATAARSALTFVKDIGWRRMDLKGDSKILHDFLTVKLPPSAYIAPILLDIRSIGALFEDVKYSWVRRQANRAVHYLA
ncbi:hypothetical protein Dimus_027443 [Dionaea muscipula]